MNSTELKITREMPEGFEANMEVGACYFVVKGHILLLQVAPGKKESGCWGVPAGKLELEESPEEGMRRELFEESGIQLPEIFKRLSPLYISKPGYDFVYHMFSATMEDFPQVTISSEHLQYCWATRSECLKMNLMSGALETLDLIKWS